MKKYRTDNPKLEEESNKLLDAYYEPTAADIEAEVLMSQDPGDRLAKHYGRQLRHGLKLVAIDRNRPREPRKRGQQYRRTRDHSPIYRAILHDLKNEATLLRKLWKDNDVQVSGRGANEQPRQAAFRIVVNRTGIADTETLLEQLELFYKNKRPG